MQGYVLANVLLRLQEDSTWQLRDDKENETVL